MHYLFSPRHRRLPSMADACLVMLSGAKDHKIRITAARKGFWSLRKVLTTRSDALSVRWARWKAEVVTRSLAGQQQQHGPNAMHYGPHFQVSE